MRVAHWAMVILLVSATPALADRLQLVNGDSLQGTIVEWEDETIVFDHPVLGRFEIARDQIVESTDPGASAAGAPVAVAATDEPQPAAEGDAPRSKKPGLFGTGFLADWTRNLSLGISGSQGKTEEASFNTQLTASHEDDRSRWKFDTAYFFSSAGGQAESNELYAELNKDWLLIDSRWFFFLTGRYDYDEFRDWDHRTAGFAGVGYQFVKRERWDLLGRTGGGANQTIGGEEMLSPEAMAGLEANWRIADGQTISTATSILPNLSDFGEFRTLSTVDWVVALGRHHGLSFKLSLKNEYESLAEEGQNDFRYVGSLGYDF